MWLLVIAVVPLLIQDPRVCLTDWTLQISDDYDA